MANISKIKLPNNSSLDVKALAIPIGTVDSTSTSTVFTFTVPGITSLYDGVIFAIRNTVVSSASGWTANVNGLGAKQVYGSNNTRITSGFAKNYWYIFVYDEANDRWTQAMLTDANSTYSNASLGQGYGTCTTAAETTAKVVTLSSYALVVGGIVAVKFDNDVPANATMNINSKGAKAIYHRGAAITAGVIKGGDTAYFIYSTYYHLLGVDRIISKVSDLTNDVGYTTNIGTVTGDSLTANNIILGNGSSTIKSSGKTIATTLGTDDTTVPTSKAVKDAIDALPEPMIFKGTLGTGGTITSLPAAAAGNTGYTYKVITNGTYQSIAAKAGDTFISNGSSWTLIPSGDEPSGTVTSVTLNATSPIAIDSSAAITTSGTRTISHANSGVTAGTYKSVTVDAKGHVTGGTNPTTLSGYGITDAKIANGVITLGSNTITPLTAESSLKEAFLTWGGKNFSADYGPVDAAMISELGANRLAFFKAENISIEYSRDGGSTWTNYDATDTTKLSLTSVGEANIRTGKFDSTTTVDNNYRVRVTFTTASTLYTVLNKFAIYISTSGSTGCKCKITKRLQSNVTSNTDVWADVADAGIRGWTGWNIINVPGIMTASGNTASAQYGQIRFEFYETGTHNDSYPHNGLTIYKIMGFGGQGWITPSTMAANGHLYSYDANKNATFPAKVTATSFVKSGGTSSQFLKADGSVDSNTYITSFTETDPVFGASAAAEITSSDISNWNSKTSNVGTITGITMNGSSKGTSGVVNLGTVVTSETDPVFTASAAAGITSSDITSWNNKVSNVQSDWNATSGLAQILNKPTIPAAVTESTVSGWGFTKNTGTVTNVVTGTGLTGGPITTTGTIGIDTDVVATKSDLEDYMLIEDYETDEEVIAAAINDLNDKIALVDSRIPAGNAKIFYGTCNTAAATTAKVVACADFTSSDLVKGALIFVTFDYTNTGAIASITLNVNDTGAKNIKKQASNSSEGSTSNLAIASELQANNTYLFQYNGTYWVCMTNDHNTNTTYSAMSASEATTGTATSARTITASVLAGAIEERITTMTQAEVTSTISTIFS